MSRGFTSAVIILGVVFFVTVAAVTFYLGKFSVSQLPPSNAIKVLPKVSPTPDETANPDLVGADWKSYQSEELNFTVKYPGELFLANEILSNYEKELDWKRKIPDLLLKCDFSGYNESNYLIKSKKSINDDPNISKVEADYRKPEGGASKITFFLIEENHHKPVALMCFFYDSAFDQKIKDILSTFKFIDQNQGKIKIIDGSVYFVPEKGKQQILADKQDFLKDPSGPLEFTGAILSPDQKKALLFAQGGITSELLFYTAVDNINVKSIHTANEAVWSHNSRYIAYNSKVADAGGNYRLNIYDTSLDRNLDLAKRPNVQGVLAYSNIQWQTDDSGVKVHYIAQSDAPHGDIIGEGDLVIPLTSFAPQQ